MIEQAELQPLIQELERFLNLKTHAHERNAIEEEGSEQGGHGKRVTFSNKRIESLDSREGLCCSSTYPYPYMSTTILRILQTVSPPWIANTKAIPK